MQEVCDVNDIDGLQWLSDNDDLGADPLSQTVVPRQRRRWVWSPRCRRGRVMILHSPSRASA